MSKKGTKKQTSKKSKDESVKSRKHHSRDAETGRFVSKHKKKGTGSTGPRGTNK